MEGGEIQYRDDSNYSTPADVENNNAKTLHKTYSSNNSNSFYLPSGNYDIICEFVPYNRSSIPISDISLTAANYIKFTLNNISDFNAFNTNNPDTITNGVWSQPHPFDVTNALGSDADIINNNTFYIYSVSLTTH